MVKLNPIKLSTKDKLARAGLQNNQRPSLRNWSPTLRKT